MMDDGINEGNCSWGGVALGHATVPKKRKRHTLSEKVVIAKKALLPDNSMSAVAREEGLPESTVRGWVKIISELEDTMAKSVHAGDLKHIRPDRTPMLNKGLLEFCKTACGHTPPLPLTTQTIIVKATEISKRLLAENEKKNDLLAVEEQLALTKLVFSKSWAFKWLKRSDCTSKLVKEENIESTMNSNNTNVDRTVTIGEGADDDEKGDENDVGDSNKSKEQNVEVFLKEAVPFLYSSDIQSYAKQLVKDGFDSSEMIAKELQREDLDFMKKAHARALWNVILQEKALWNVMYQDKHK